jgi:hypothetical protein
MPDNTSIVIDEGTYSITASAFYGCSGLTSVTIPNSLTNIGAAAFSDCSNLTKVELDCNEIVSKSRITEIFGNQVKEYVLGNSVTSIGDWAFSYSSELTTIEIPKKVIRVGKHVFYGCTNLTSIVVDIENSVYDSRDNCNAIIETSTNTLIAGCATSTIPNTITTIGEEAFKDCSGLTAVNIPYSVMSIGANAFSGCCSISRVEINSNAIVSKDYTSDASISNIFGSQVTEYVFGDAITSIGDFAFYNSSSLTTFNIPNGVKSVGNEAFNGTVWYNNQLDGIVYAGKNLYKHKGPMPENTSIVIKEGTYSITPKAFYDCSGLTAITMPNSLMTIGYEAFEGCTGLTTVSIPSNVEYIGELAFNRCNGLTTIHVDSENKVYDSRENCNAIIETTTNRLITGCQNTVIPNSVTKIFDSAFHNCIGLTTMSIPNSVSSIGNSAFEGCDRISEITIGKGITEMGENTFSNCPALKNIYLYAQELPAITPATFENTIYQNATLHVPADAVEDYSWTDPWSNFYRIIALADSDPKPMGIINISNDDMNGECYYSIDGKQLNKSQRGLNIIRMKNGTTRKVMKK